MMLAESSAANGKLLSRTVSLEELGRAEGLEFRRLSGGADVFFPVGRADALRRAVLRLDLRHGRTIAVARHLTVFLADRIAHVEPLDGRGAAGGGRQTVEIPVPPEAVSGGFVKVSLSYSGANSEKICIDERASGDFLVVEPTSEMLLEIDGGALVTPLDVVRIMPPRKRLVFDDAASPGTLAFALRAAAQYGAETGLLGLERDAAPGPVWRDVALHVAQDANAEGALTAAVTGEDGMPGLLFGGTQPQLGLGLLTGRWQALAGAGSVRTTGIGAAAPGGGRTTLSALGVPELRQDVAGSGVFQFSFAADDFPAGRLPDELELLIAAARTPEARGVTVSVSVNGTLIGNRPLDSGVPVWMGFPLPEGLVGQRNEVEVLVQRQTQAGNCLVAPQGYPVQILPQSRFLLKDAGDSGADFFRLRQAYAGGVALVTEANLDIGAALPWLLPIAGAMLPDTAEVLPAPGLDDTATANLPFLYVGEAAPPGSAPGLRFDRGRVEIRDSADGLLYSGEALGTVGAVQIVSQGDRPGLWVRPGGGPAPKPTRTEPLILDRGNIAILDGRGLALAVSRDRQDLLEVRYPDRVDVMQVLARYRPWIVGAVWLAATLLLIRFLQGLYRRGRSGAGS